MNQNFPKSERLRHKTLVDGLFREGKSLFEYPVRLVYRPLTQAQLDNAFNINIPDRIAPLQVMVTVPKKKRRHAVDRVRMRRRIREGWRLQRRRLREAVEAHPEFRTLSVALICAADTDVDSNRIHAKIGKLISRLISLLSIDSDSSPINPPINPTTEK
ncbi:hypothetical protein HDR69_02235 [bacterium]|nr:hypothetical protein [Bacteroides sp.]MBD5385233.1 hypothetical protein [bacterium]MDE6805337.1 ribonuclease P protein component [Muribaculaceae bacterium]MDE7509248.1 ribonuclease P protein component [Muribaculaceae bacterium]